MYAYVNLPAILQAQAILLVFLGGVVLLAHKTSRSVHGSSSARWFFAASACGGLGLLLQSFRGRLPTVLSVTIGNVLFLCLTFMLTRAIALATGSGLRRVTLYMSAVVAIIIPTMSYFAYIRPQTTTRVLIASIALPLLLWPSIAMLLRCRERAIMPATRTLSGVLSVFVASCLYRIVTILHGAQAQSGANWTGAILISGMGMCFLWMDLLRTRAELERQTMTDPLTDLLNRRGLSWLGERELARCTRSGLPLTLLTMDLDGFKSINDRYGHTQGDAALRGVADILRNTLRPMDLAVRAGGDEFLVLLPASSREVAACIRDRVSAEVRGLRIVTPEKTAFTVSLSVGSYTTEPGTDLSFLELLHRSDLDLYRQKQARAARRAAIPVLLLTGLRQHARAAPTSSLPV